MTNLKTITNPYLKLLELSKAQARQLFITNHLSITPTGLTVNTFWLNQNGDRIGEIMLTDEGWFSNNRILFDAPFPSFHLASLAELISYPIKSIPSKSLIC